MPEREVWVWFPPGFNEAAQAGERFPVQFPTRLRCSHLVHFGLALVPRNHVM
jgi:hypothetical protein